MVPTAWRDGCIQAVRGDQCRFWWRILFSFSSYFLFCCFLIFLLLLKAFLDCVGLTVGVCFHWKRDILDIRENVVSLGFVGMWVLAHLDGDGCDQAESGKDGEPV